MPKSIVPLEAVGSTDSVTNREVTGGASSALRWEMGGGGGGWTGTTVGGTFWVGYMMMMYVGSPAAGSGYAGRRVATKVSAASSVSDSSRDGLNPISSMMTSSSHLSL